MTRFETALAAIDAANAQDPTLEPDGETMRPAALLYGLRMSAELERQAPEASEPLRLAARGQHIERWLTPRAQYPEGRDGYLAWRRGLAEFHGRRVAEIMAAAGYDAAAGARVAQLLRKEGLKRDPETQRLEDVICFVFMRHYLQPFAADRDPEQLRDIVTKTARKMSAEARASARAQFALPPDLAAALM